MNWERLAESGEIFVDNCTGVLQEVPENFDNGRIKVQLTVSTISRNFIAIGSECGALFLYNRNLNRTVKPLRTADYDPVTAVELFSLELENYLAVGRKSGQLIIMCLPSDKIRKIRQSIHDDVHAGKAITCLRWSPDGKRLYSADICGQIIATDVDFDNEIYSCMFVAEMNGPVRELVCDADWILFCSMNEWTVIEAKTLKTVGSDVETDENVQLIGCAIVDGKFWIANSEGKVTHVMAEKNREEIDKFSDVILYENLPKLTVDGIVQLNPVQQVFKMVDLTLKTSHFIQYSTDCMIIWTSEKVALINPVKKQFIGLDIVKLYDDDLLEVISVVVDENTSEMYLLTRNQKILRISTSKVIQELLAARIQPPTNTYSLMGSFMSAAQNSSSIFSKFSNFRELESLKELRQNPKFFELQNKFSEAVEHVAARSAQSAESGKTFANGLMEQIKNSPLYSDFDGRRRDSTDEMGEDENAEKEDSESFPSKFSDSSDQELVVNRRRKTRINNEATRDVLYGIESNSIKEQKTEDFLASGALEAGILDIDDGILDDIITGKYQEQVVVVEEEVGGTVDVPDEDCVNVHRRNSGDSGDDLPSVVDEGLEEGVDDHEIVLRPHSTTSSVFSTRDIVPETAETLEAAAEKCQKEIVEEQQIYDSYEDIQSILPALDSGCFLPDYTVVTSIANHRTDTWNIMTAPFTVKTFDVTCSYVIIIPTKYWRYYPHFRIFDVLSNGLRGGGWSAYKESADQVAVNDQGNILWKIHKKIAYAPAELDFHTPVGSGWHKQADKVYQAAMTTKHGWYVTSDDIFVQMMLPELGILHKTDCAFKISSITASDHAVWALREGKGNLIARTGIDDQICPMGVDWVEDSLYGPNKFVSVALHDETGFGLDSEGKLWFINGVNEKNPLGQRTWFQCCEPLFLSQINVKKANVNSWMLKVSSYGVFISIGKQLLISTQPLTGHLIKKLIPERLVLHDNFSIISAAGKNGVFVCQPNSEIFVFSPEKRNLKSIPHFDTDFSIVALSSTLERLYVLDNCGNLCVRRGFNSDLTPLGHLWDRIEPVGIESPICSIAVSTNSLWIVTTTGQIYIATEHLRLSSTLNFIKVEPPKLATNDKIDQIRCSPTGKYVWIFSMTSGRCYARSGIDGSTQFRGTSWIDAPADVKVVDIAVGENVVWCLSQHEKRVHRLRNMSQSNIVGIGWRPMPFFLRAITVDSEESRLYGIDLENRLVVHEMDVYPRACLAQKINPRPGQVVDSNITTKRDSEESWTDVGNTGYSIFK